MRTAALLAILVLVAYAAEPAAANPPSQTPAATPAPPAPPAAAAPAPATSTAAATVTRGPSPETLKKARKIGLFPRVRNGQTVYCKNETAIGSRIPTEHCYASDALDDIIRNTQQTQDMMLRSGACPNAACGGN